jgi:hypothetical protein
MEPSNQNPTQPQDQQDTPVTPQVAGSTVSPQPASVTGQAPPPQPSIVVGGPSEGAAMPPAGKSNSRVIGIGLALLFIVILAVLGFIIFGNKSKKTPVTNNQVKGQTDNQGATKTYTGQFMTLQYPSSWQVQADNTTNPPIYYLVPPNANSSSDGGLSINGEDNFTANAKNNDPKTYYKTATSSSDATAVTSNSNTINGNQAYSEEDTFEGVGGNEWNVIVSKDGTKVWFSFSDGPNTAAYNQVIQSIKFK